MVVTELLLARSQTAAVYVDYLDAYPTGFELEVRATAVPFERSRADVFGRHRPMMSETSEELRPELLRIGVQFADGETATNIDPYSGPPPGPVMWPLFGGGLHQGYWVSPLPSAGPVALLCEWPAAGIPLTRHEIDSRLVLDGADRARALFADQGRVRRDGRHWRTGTDAEVAWINAGTSLDATITVAIPPNFASYCTLMLPADGRGEQAGHEQAVLALLSEHTEEQPWWLGYLDTGGRSTDVVFPYAPRATVYQGYGYVLVEAGPQQAANWRTAGFNWALPDLMFPADRSWLLSTMWDDDWTCVGGPEALVSSFLRHPELAPRARRVALGEDPTPPGHG